MMNSALKYDSLASLDSSKYEWRIKVRVIRIWDSFSTKGDKDFKGRNMLLLDDKHNRIHAFIWPNYMNEFKDTFEEGKIYSIRNFAVKTYRKETLRCTRYDKQIWFSSYTKAVKIEDDQKSDKMIRQMEFDFFDIGDIPEILKQPDNNYLIDIIGVLTYKDELRQFTNQKEVEQCSFRFTLSDGSSSTKLCFWDDFARSFAAEIEKVDVFPIIVIVASCKVNEYKSEPYVSNVGATRYYVNYNHRSVQQLRQRAILPEFNKNNAAPGIHEMSRVMTIAQLRTLDSTFIMEKILVQVSVRTVKESKDWNFDACSSCKKECDFILDKFKCEECKRTIPFPDKRFRLCLLVEDESGSAAIILSDREVENITGKTVFEVLNEQTTAEFPKALKVFEGKQYTVTICLNEDNVVNGSHTYYAVDIYEGFEFVGNVTMNDDDDFSVGIKISESSSQFTSSNSVSTDMFKTPDTEKSANNGNRLKRLNNDASIPTIHLDDERNSEVDQTDSKKKFPVKQIKKEK